MFGLPPAHYDKWPLLRQNFNMVSTSKDRNGVEYVSSAEHKHYPFFATQVRPRLRAGGGARRGVGWRRAWWCAAWEQGQREGKDMGSAARTGLRAVLC